MTGKWCWLQCNKNELYRTWDGWDIDENTRKIHVGAFISPNRHPKVIKMGSFPKKWRWRPWMVYLCSIPFDAMHPLQWRRFSPSGRICTLGSKNTKMKIWGFPQKYPTVSTARARRDASFVSGERFFVARMRNVASRRAVPGLLRFEKFNRKSKIAVTLGRCAGPRCG